MFFARIYIYKTARAVWWRALFMFVAIFRLTPTSRWRRGLDLFRPLSWYPDLLVLYQVVSSPVLWLRKPDRITGQGQTTISYWKTISRDLSRDEVGLLKYHADLCPNFVRVRFVWILKWNTTIYILEIQDNAKRSLGNGLKQLIGSLSGPRIPRYH